jgi:hypothetical protein
MSVDSEIASVYHLWEWNYYEKLFHDFTSNLEVRRSLVHAYLFESFSIN